MKNKHTLEDYDSRAAGFVCKKSGKIFYVHYGSSDICPTCGTTIEADLKISWKEVKTRKPY